MTDGLKVVDIIVPAYNEIQDAVEAAVRRIEPATVTGPVP